MPEMGQLLIGVSLGHMSTICHWRVAQCAATGNIGQSNFNEKALEKKDFLNEKKNRLTIPNIYCTLNIKKIRYLNLHTLLYLFAYERIQDISKFIFLISFLKKAYIMTFIRNVSV